MYTYGLSRKLSIMYLIESRPVCMKTTQLSRPGMPRFEVLLQRHSLIVGTSAGASEAMHHLRTRIVDND